MNLRTARYPISVLCCFVACAGIAWAAQWIPISQSAVPPDVLSYFRSHYKTNHGVVKPDSTVCFSDDEFGGRARWTRYKDDLSEADRLNGVTSRTLYAVQYSVYRESSGSDWKENDAAGPTNGTLATIERSVRHGKVMVKNRTFCL